VIFRIKHQEISMIKFTLFNCFVYIFTCYLHAYVQTKKLSCLFYQEQPKLDLSM
jgi:hypothetical protein